MESRALRRTSPGPRIPSGGHRAGTQPSRARGWVSQSLVAHLSVSLGGRVSKEERSYRDSRILFGCGENLGSFVEDRHHGGRL